MLGFPTGALTTRIDRLIVAGFAFGTVVLQVVWVLDESVNTFQSAFNATMGVVLGAVAIARWARAAPPLRRLLGPTLAGGVAVLILAAQIYHELLSDDFVRSSQEVAAVVLVAVPLAFLLGILRTHYARAGMAVLVTALQQAPDSRRLGELLDQALAYEPELADVVGAAGGVVDELAGSRARIMEAGDTARRQIERDLHDGAQQRLVAIAMTLRLTEERIREDPDTAAELVAAARQDLSASLAELRELARGIHPAALEHGLRSPCRAWRPGRRCPCRSKSSSTSGSRAPSSLRRTSWPARRWPTRPSTPRRRTSPSPSRAGTRPSRSPSRTTGSAARTARADPGCAGSPTASVRSPVACTSSARPAAGRC